jgi:hypothetical protein
MSAAVTRLRIETEGARSTFAGREEVSMMSRRTLTALLGALFASANAAAAASCRVIDATGDFWPLVERSAEATAAEQAAAFRADVIARFPELYTRDVLGTDDSRQLDEESVAALAAARKNRMHARQTEQSLERKIPGYIARFSRSFPDFHCDFPIYLMISLGHMDGAGRVVGASRALVLGVEVIDRIETPAQIPVFFEHELFHRYNYRVAGFSDDPGDRQPIWRTLWAEGLATYVSAELNPDHPLSDAMIFPPDLAERAAPEIGQLARALRDNDAPNPSLYAEYFEAGRPEGGIPPRAGYYVGYRVAFLAARSYSLYQLAHLRGADLHRNINRWLDELASGKVGLDER